MTLRLTLLLCLPLAAEANPTQLQRRHRQRRPWLQLEWRRIRAEHAELFSPS